MPNMNQGNVVADVLQARELAGVIARLAIGANLTLQAGHPSLSIIDPATTSRNVNLPLETASKDRILIIMNIGTATGTLVLQSNAGAALSPAKTIAVGGGAICFCDGVAWRAMLMT